MLKHKSQEYGYLLDALKAKLATGSELEATKQAFTQQCEQYFRQHTIERQEKSVSAFFAHFDNTDKGSLLKQKIAEKTSR